MMIGKSRVCQKYGPLVARILLAALFIMSGLGMAMNIGGTSGFFASLGIPMATAAVIVVVIVKIGGGLMVASGVHAREGALALAIFTILATLIAHMNWADQAQMTQALKNIAIIGGLLMVMFNGAGSLRVKCPCPMCKNKVCGSCEDCCDSCDKHDDVTPVM